MLLDLQARVRDYVTVLGLDLVLDEAEGSEEALKINRIALPIDAPQRLTQLLIG